MALGVEPREKTLMKRSPRDPNTGVVTLAVWIVILSQSLLIAALTLGSYVLALYRYNYPVPEAQSLVSVDTFMNVATLLSFIDVGIYLSHHDSIDAFIPLSKCASFSLQNGIAEQSMDGRSFPHLLLLFDPGDLCSWYVGYAFSFGSSICMETSAQGIIIKSISLQIVY